MLKPHQAQLEAPERHFHRRALHRLAVPVGITGDAVGAPPGPILAGAPTLELLQWRATGRLHLHSAPQSLLAGKYSHCTEEPRGCASFPQNHTPGQQRLSGA